MRFVFQAQSIGRGGCVGGKLNVQKQERESVQTRLLKQIFANKQSITTKSERKDSNNEK